MKKDNGTLQAPYAPVEVHDADVVFPAHVWHLMPPEEDIPGEFWKLRGNKWVDLFSTLFSKGTSFGFWAKEGIDPNKAWRHLRCVMGTWSTPHEYKSAACAFLMSTWFLDYYFGEEAPLDHLPEGVDHAHGE